MPHRSWRFRIQDILDAIDRASRYIEGHNLTTFSEDSLVVDAILRNLTVIGEAVTHVPDEVRERFPDVPWLDVQGMRNIVVHEYFGVSVPIVWQTVAQDLPRLRAQLEAVLASSPPDRTD
jgi:uncharacterized protein with HEPN domain